MRCACSRPRFLLGRCRAQAAHIVVTFDLLEAFGAIDAVSMALAGVLGGDPTTRALSFPEPLVVTTTPEWNNPGTLPGRSHLSAWESEPCVPAEPRTLTCPTSSRS